MPANNRSSRKSDAAGAVARELDQLKKKVKELALKLEREAKARELAARLAVVAKKAREQLTREIKTLREQGGKMASELMSAITDANKRKQTVEEARELRAELARRTADLKHKSEELKKLARESAHRAAVIIGGASQSAAEPAQSSVGSRPSEPGPEDHPSDKPTPT